ncbi:MAG: hypothetical protein FWC41_04465 [Firmicutes bacterium]|nr:hypothetical protein [Bacillota bacterium]MCL2311729.1 hypothetical protein [Bacillota bacterium]
MIIEIVESKQCEIPNTTKENYITGIYALNLPTDNGSKADWHDVFHWRNGIEKPREITVAGINTESTGFIYNGYGVCEGKKHLLNVGLIVDKPNVYVANHCRAILDMVYDCLYKYNAIYNLTGALDDWFDKETDIQEFISRCSEMKNFVDEEKKNKLEKWLASEIEECEL